MNTKICPRCKEPFSDLYYKSGRKRCYCIPCANKIALEQKRNNWERHREMRIARRETENAANTIRRKQYRIDALNHYGKKCACCGEDRQEFLAIDHIEGGGNKHRESIGQSVFYIWLKTNNYPEGFRVLCHNCNMSLGFYGYCPHKQKGT